jgi:hypothetical protein
MAMVKNLTKKETIEIVLKLVNKFATEKKGSLFVISKNDVSKYYDQLYPDLFSGKNINIKEKETQILLEKLADLDGAFVINEDGKILVYGAKLKKTKVFLGHGTRHSAALGITDLKDVMAILSSEEDGMVRIFKNHRIIAEINPRTGKNEKFIEKLANLFSKAEIQVATSGGVASLLMGLNPLLAGAIFTGSWIVTKFGLASVKEFTSTGKIVIQKEEQDKNIKSKKKK